MEINTHGMRIQFGKHKGQRYTRLPVDYLEWLINENTQVADVARAELIRRGHDMSSRKVDVTHHAIDRASLRIMGVFLADHQKNEGFYSWLVRVSIENLATIDYEEQGQDFRFDMPDMKLVFKKGELYPTLVTVMKPGYDKQD